jgi:RNA polymerase sigma factor (sigma-70 family)
MTLLRLRSDEQLVALLRAGHAEAFQVIHDRYRQRLFAYVAQMLPQRQDAEDALQEVFERAYAGLLRTDRDLALRPWLYTIARNRCVDHLRRPSPPPPETLAQIGGAPVDPVAEVDRRDALRRLITDVRRLPERQRSALLMRELGGIPYADVAQALGVTVPAVKSLLVRARTSLICAGQARDADCEQIRAELVIAHEERHRPDSVARRHLRDCPSCRAFRGQMRGMRRQLLGLSSPLAAFGALARVLGGGGSGSAALSGAGGGGVAFAGANAGHMATLFAATFAAAGGVAVLHPPSHASAPRHAARGAMRHVRPTTSVRRAIAGSSTVARARVVLRRAVTERPRAASRRMDPNVAVGHPAPRLLPPPAGRSRHGHQLRDSATRSRRHGVRHPTPKVLAPSGPTPSPIASDPGGASGAAPNPAPDSSPPQSPPAGSSAGSDTSSGSPSA